MAATVYEKVIGAILAALQTALPEKAVGTPYNLINLTIGGEHDQSTYIGYLFSEGGFGARSTKDGPAGRVSRSVFWPVPNVDSALVAFGHRAPPATTAAREDVFRVVDAVFAQRRKTMRSTLAALAGSPAAAESALRAAGVDPGARGERVGITDLARVAEALTAGS